MTSVEKRHNSIGGSLGQVKILGIGRGNIRNY